MSYATMDHAKWVESNNYGLNQINAKRRRWKPVPEKLSLFQAKVMDICGMVGGGIYNAPINWERVEWGAGKNASFGMVCVPWRDGRMATFDARELTWLVLLCHEARIRCDVRASARGHFLLIFHQRGHDGHMFARHPNIDETVAAFRQYLPENHRVTYCVPDAQPTLEAEAAA